MKGLQESQVGLPFSPTCHLADSSQSCWLIAFSWGGCVHAVGGQCGLISVSLYLHHREQIWLISQHLKPDSADHNRTPRGSLPHRLFFSVSHSNLYTGVPVFVVLSICVAPHSSYLNNTSLPCSNGALWEYALHAKGVGSDSAIISMQRCVCLRVCG